MIKALSIYFGKAFFILGDSLRAVSFVVSLWSSLRDSLSFHFSKPLLPLSHRRLMVSYA